MLFPMLLLATGVPENLLVRYGLFKLGPVGTRYAGDWDWKG